MEGLEHTVYAAELFNKALRQTDPRPARPPGHSAHEPRQSRPRLHRHGHHRRAAPHRPARPGLPEASRSSRPGARASSRSSSRPSRAQLADIIGDRGPEIPADDRHGRAVHLLCEPDRPRARVHVAHQQAQRHRRLRPDGLRLLPLAGDEGPGRPAGTSSISPAPSPPWPRSCCRSSSSAISPGRCRSRSGSSATSSPRSC